MGLSSLQLQTRYFYFQLLDIFISSLPNQKAMMLVALLLLACQVNARELQGKEVVVVTKSRQPTRYYKPTYTSKTHYSTPIVNVVPSKQKKMIPSHSKKVCESCLNKHRYC
eukprot:TRINITY_DN2780_c0_g1_i6.p3 TRINITY_DN2780_c0_g1~~TRINITY_DN2780_c0_g1_i6.p3  ORF type:complete len:111 (+),score=5.45 TRINITY_DN2780_c0_g1_i6:3-335(+)